MLASPALWGTMFPLGSLQQLRYSFRTDGVATSREEARLEVSFLLELLKQDGARQSVHREALQQPAEAPMGN